MSVDLGSSAVTRSEDLVGLIGGQNDQMFSLT
jgi:hypothetical protein